MLFSGYESAKYSIEVDGNVVAESFSPQMSSVLFEYNQTNGAIEDADFVVTVDGNEVERIKSTIDVVLSKEAVDYSINPDGTLSFGNNAHGAYVYKSFLDDKVSQLGRIAFENGELKPGWTTPTLEDGETIYIMRADCVWDATTNHITASISKHIGKTYAEDTTPEIILSQNDSQNDYNITASWPDYGYENYCLSYINSRGETVRKISCNHNSSSIRSTMPLPDEGTEIYTLVVSATEAETGADIELAKLNQAVEITVSEQALNYEILFNYPEEGKHTFNLTDNNTPDGIAMRHVWYNESGVSVSSGMTAPGVSTTGSYSMDIQIDYSFDLRVISALSLDGQTAKSTITAPGVKRYTKYHASTLRFEPYGNSLYCLDWDGIEPSDMENVFYQVMATQDFGMTWEPLGEAYYESKLPLFVNGTAYYNGFKVISYLDNIKIAETVTSHLSADVAKSTGEQATAEVEVTDENTIVSLGNLTPNTYFCLYGSTTSNFSKAQSIFQGTSDSVGTYIKTINNDTHKQLITNGYFMVIQYQDYNLSEDGKALSYTSSAMGRMKKVTIIE